MPLDEEFLRDRLDLRAQRSRNRALVPDIRPAVRDLHGAPSPSQQAEFVDISSQSIIGLGTIDGMVT